MSLYLTPTRNGYEFASLKQLHLFLDLESPYDTCLDCEEPRSKYSSAKCRTRIPDILKKLVGSPVPSPGLASCLRDLSNLVVCEGELCQKEGARRHLYETWCDKLWRHYLRAHELNPKDVGSRPRGFTKEEWESAVGEDDSSSDSAPELADDSAYWSNDENSSSGPDCDPDCDPDDGPDADLDDDSSPDGDADDSPNGDEDGNTDGDGDESTGRYYDASTDGHNAEDTAPKDLGICSLPIKSEARPETKGPSFSSSPLLSNNKHRKKLLELMMRNIASDKNCCPGYIYGFRRPDLPGYIKIGYIRDKPENQDEPQTTTVRKSPGKSTKRRTKRTKRTVEIRQAEWKRDCQHDIVEVFDARIECDAIQRIESLIHTTLHEYRRTQDPPCEPCRKRSKDGSGGKHDEWFEVDEDTALEVVNFWERFAQLQPYNLGRLTDFWQKKIKNQLNAKNSFPEDYSVKSWMKAMTSSIELLAA